MSSAKWRPFCLGPNVLNRFVLGERLVGPSQPKNIALPAEIPFMMIKRSLDRLIIVMESSYLKKRFQWTPLKHLFWWNHDDVIKWKHFPRYWPFVRGIHRSPVNSHTKASDAELRSFLWSVLWIIGWVNNHEAGDLRRHRALYDVIVMCCIQSSPNG